MRPHLEYCSSVWNPHTQTDVNRIEAVQRRAARFCSRRYKRKRSPKLMPADLGWSLLSARREQARLILMFKLCHSLVNVNSSKTLIPITRPTRLSHPYTYQRPAAVKKIPSAFFLPTNNSPMEQPARHPGMRTHRGCLQLCFKGALYIIWCGVNRLGDSGVKVV